MPRGRIEALGPTSDCRPERTISGSDAMCRVRLGGGIGGRCGFPTERTIPGGHAETRTDRPDISGRTRTRAVPHVAAEPRPRPDGHDHVLSHGPRASGAEGNADGDEDADVLRTVEPTEGMGRIWGAFDRGQCRARSPGFACVSQGILLRRTADEATDAADPTSLMPGPVHVGPDRSLLPLPTRSRNIPPPLKEAH